MRKSFEFVFVFMCLGFLFIHNQIVYSQTRYCTSDMPFDCLVRPSEQAIEACRAELRHLNVQEYPPTIMLPGAKGYPKGGKIQTPKRLLSSQDGIEVYADSPPSSWVAAPMYGVKILLVYQDEGVRQWVINNLRGKNLLPSPGTGALVDDLKYAMVHLMPEIQQLPISGQTLKEQLFKLDKAFAGKWYIQEFEYDQPEACVDIFQKDVRGFPLTPGTWITSVNIPGSEKLRLDSYPLLLKALEAMRAWMKECAFLIGP